MPRSKATDVLYTLVEHNGLPGGVMHVSVATEAKAEKLRGLGALILTSYVEANEAEEFYNFHDVPEGIYPIATRNGHFSTRQHDYQSIYIPNPGLEAIRQQQSKDES